MFGLMLNKYGNKMIVIENVPIDNKVNNLVQALITKHYKSEAIDVLGTWSKEMKKLDSQHRALACSFNRKEFNQREEKKTKFYDKEIKQYEELLKPEQEIL